MAHFLEGIKNFENMGGPDLHGPLMTWEDVQFATKMNKFELENCTNEEVETYDDNQDGFPDILKEDYESFFDDNKKIQCGACGKD